MKKLIILTFLLFTLAAWGAPRLPRPGYRGFVDFDWSCFHINNRWQDNSQNHYSFATVHGYQITPRIFAGAGVALNHNAWAQTNAWRVFGDVRTDLMFGRFTPFGDVRIGWGCAEDGGIYFSPTVGYRFNWGRKLGINLGLGMTVQGYMEYSNAHVDESGYWTYDSRRKAAAAFTVRIGFDF